MTGNSPSVPLYTTKAAAGADLGNRLAQRIRPPVVVWGVAPTGVEVAASASKALGCPFDVVIGGHIRLEGLGVVGAMAEDADAVLDPNFQPRFGVMEALDEAIDRARRAIKTERLLFRGQRPIRSVSGTTLVIVDGHVTTSWKLLAAAQVAEGMGATRLVMAAAVSTHAVREHIAARRLEFACPHVVPDAEGHPRPFGDPQDPSAERLRSIVVARQAA
jgi:predicted phosphoribosyltransferase